MFRLQNYSLRRFASATATQKSKRQALLLTEAAADRIKELMSFKEEDIFGVRVGVRRRGCNGYSYVMNYAEENNVQRLDELIEQHGVRVIVDSKALLFLIGTEMDYVDNEIKAEFVFNNPNAKGECGCGESFHV